MKSLPPRIRIENVQPATDCGRSSGQAHRRRRCRGQRDDLPRQQRHPRRPRPLPRPRRRKFTSVPLVPLGQRPLHRLVRGDRARTLAVHRRGLERPLRHLARRAPAQGRGRSEGSCRASLPRASCSSAFRASTSRRGSPRRCPTEHDLVRADSVRDRGRPRSRALRRLVRALPALLRRLRRRRAGLARARRPRLRRGLPAADPPDRALLAKGPQQHAAGEARRSRQPVGDRRGGGRPRRDPPRARNDRRLRPLGRAGEGARPRDRARPGDPVLARPPVAEGASGVVPPQARRDDQVRREPARRNTRTSST